MSTKTILVQLADHDSTVRALRTACLRARNDRRGATITLVHLSRVPQIGWLGAPELLELPQGAARQTALECAAIAEQVGVKLTLLPFQYDSLPDAIADAADLVDAGMVFATLPPVRLPAVDRWRTGALRRRLARHGRDLVLTPHEELRATGRGRLLPHPK